VDDSLPVPYLKHVAQPSEWEPTPPPDLTPRQQKCQAFFTGLLEKVKAQYPSLTRKTKAYLQSWHNPPAGRSGFAIATSCSQHKHMRVELYIDGCDRAKKKRHLMP
jgi:hypothetical protein